MSSVSLWPITELERRVRGTLRFVVGQAEVWAVWLTSTVGYFSRAGPLACGACANWVVSVRTELIAGHLTGVRELENWLLPGKTTPQYILQKISCLAFIILLLFPHVLWPNTGIMHLRPLLTSEMMIFEVCRLPFSKNSANFWFGLFSLNHHY